MIYQVYLLDPRLLARGTEEVVGTTNIYEEISAYRAKKAYWKEYLKLHIPWKFIQHYLRVHILQEEE